MSELANRPSSGVSKTCIYVASGRAIGAREPDSALRNPDYLAEQLLGDPATLDFDNPAVRALSLGYDEAMQDFEVARIVRTMMVRTRFIDDALERAIRDGATQVVVLGAGFDSHAYRCRDLLARARIFEVDRPATQAVKKQRVNDVLGGPPANLTYVAFDLDQGKLVDALLRHGYDPTQRAFFIMEGVTMYLPEEAVRDTLRLVAAHPPGSGIVFDFVYRAMIDALARVDMASLSDLSRRFMLQFLDMTRNEPWVFGLPVGGERDYLGGLGLELREALEVGGAESLRRYATKADGTLVGVQARGDVTAQTGAERPAAEQAPPQPRREMAYVLVEAFVASRA